MQHPHRKRRHCRRVPFVDVEPASQRQHLTSRQRSGDQPAEVSRNRRHGKSREIGIWHESLPLDPLAEFSETGAEDEASHRLLNRECGANLGGYLVGRRKIVANDLVHAGTPRSPSMAARALAISSCRSFHGRKALSNPFMATCARSSKLSPSSRDASSYSSVSVVPLMSRLSVLSTTLRPRFRYCGKGCCSSDGVA